MPCCWGSPLIVSATSETCRACLQSASCTACAVELLGALPDTPAIKLERQALAVTRQALVGSPSGQGKGQPSVKVVATSRGAQRIELTADQERAAARMPARVGSQVRQLMRKGWMDYARVELKHGRNPGDSGWKQVLCRLLLSGDCNRQEIQAAFVAELGLSEGSAKTQTSTALSIFAFGRLIREEGGIIRIGANSQN